MLGRVQAGAERDFWLPLALLVAVGLVLRIVYALAIAGDDPLVGDGLEIHGIANAVADGRGFITPIVPEGQEPTPTAHKPPLYPLALALVSALGGSGYEAHHVATAVIGSAAVVVIALLARHLAGARTGLIAGATAALYPVFIAADASLRSETLYVLLSALVMLACYRAYEHPSAGRLALLGALIGLAALTRGEALVLLLLLAVPAVWRGAREGRPRRLAVVCAVCALVVAPWLVRSWSAFDQPVLISTNSGDLLAGANCDSTYSGPLTGGWAFGCALLPARAGENEADVSVRLRERGLDYARDHAGRLPVVLAARALRPWGLYQPAEQIRLRVEGEGQRRRMDWLGLACFWLLAAAALAGALILRRRRVPLFVLVAPVVLVLLVSVAGYGVFRFRAPADVSVLVLAAVALDAGLARLRDQSASRSAAASTTSGSSAD